ncbi:MAG: hypothetical protein ACOZQL_26500 [Myxococcota bacterium]
MIRSPSVLLLLALTGACGVAPAAARAPAAAEQALSAGPCGNGVLNEGEQCDDGNTIDGDFCNSTCSQGLDTRGVNCSETALQAMVDAAVAKATAEGRLDLATIVELPNNAQLRFCEEGCTRGDPLPPPYDDHPRACVVLPRRVWLRGNASRIKLPRNLVAIQVAPNAGESIVEHLDIVFPGDADPSVGPGQAWRPFPHEGIGVRVKAGVARLRDLNVFHAGVGLSFLGTGGTNVNAASVRDVWIFGCSRRGIDIRGGDANAGNFMGVMVQACANATHDAVAIAENGFLGNLHLGHLLESNDINVQTEQAQAANYSAWVGTYVEDGADDLHSANTVVVGGGLATKEDVPRGARISGMNSHLMFGGRDVSGHGNYMEIPNLNADGAHIGFMEFGRWPQSNRACSSTSDCLDRLDVCGSNGRCVRAGNLGYDYWEWRRSPNDAVNVFEWEFFNNSVSTSAFRARVSDVNGDGVIREGTLSPGGYAGYCGYFSNQCAP